MECVEFVMFRCHWSSSWFLDHTSHVATHWESHSSMQCHKWPTFHHKSPIFQQKSPTFQQKSPTFHQKSPIFRRSVREKVTPPWNVTSALHSILNESCPTSEWACPTSEWVMSPHLNESCPTSEWVMSHAFRRSVRALKTFRNASCPAY